MSVADFCKRFNISLNIKPRYGQIGNPLPLIRLNKQDANENSMITEDSMLSVTGKWMFGSGPRGDFKEWMERLALTGSGIGGHPPFEELFDFEKDHLR